MGIGTDTLDGVTAALISAGLGQITSPGTDWFISQGYLPDGLPLTDRAIAIYDTPGRPPERGYLNPLDYPSVQVVVRGGEADYQLVRDRIQDIYMALNEQEPAIKAGATSPFIYFYSQQSAPLSMGRDEKKRPKLSWNFRSMRYRPSASQVLDSYVQGNFSTPTPGVTSLSSFELARTVHDFSILNFPDMTVVNFPGLTAVGGDFNTITLPVLTTYNFPLLETIGGGADIQDIYLLTALNLPALTSVGAEFAVQGMNAATSFNLPLFATAGAGVHIFDSFFSALSFPALTTTGAGEFQVNDLSHVTSINAPNLLNTSIVLIYDCPLLTALTLTALNSSPDINIHDNAILTALNFPALTTASDAIIVHDMPALTTLSMPVAENIGGSLGIISATTGTDALANVTFGSSLQSVGCDVTFSSCALTQASVDGILVALAALNGSGGTTSYDGHTVTLTGTSAAPSGTGLAAKATLEGRGNTVTVN